MRPALSFLAACALAGLALLGAAPAAAQSSIDAPAAVAIDTNDFFFESFDADYYLGVDENGRSTLTTVETFVAVFPEIDQNRGMRRAIPLKYQGQPTDIDLQSVTDENGAPRPVETETEDDFLLVTSRADGFVHGKQTYVFTYTQHNVTRFFEDTGDDEFYWDTNGTGWYQSFGAVSARVHVPTDLAGALSGDNACYYGYEGAGNRCEVTSADEPGGVVLSVVVPDVGPMQNVTVAVGFAPHTFVPRDDSYLGSPLGFLQVIAGLGSIGALIWAIVARSTVLRDGRGRPTVIAEYTPPEGIDLVTASVILKKTPRAAAAQFVDFAVKRHVRIIETEKTGWFASGSTYLLELLDPTGLKGAELELARALFGSQLTPGSSYLMTTTDTALSKRVRAIIAAATAEAASDGLRKQGTVRHAVLPALLGIGSAVAAFVLGVILLDNSIGGVVPVLLFVPAILVVLVVFGLVSRTPLTEKGAELRDHLKGLELYIRLAEADRLRMLQSPEGAEKAAISTSDPREVVRLYEKLLPYAVLFSLEKDWALELGKYYTEESPDWYRGSSAFNAALFASSIGSMSSAAASSYSGSSSSSSSGGSGGGGSSGGGGGGGGGGGV